MNITIQHLSDYGSVAFRAAQISLRLFTWFLASMGILLWMSDQPVTWAQAWPYGIMLWGIGIGLQLPFTGRI